MKKLSLNRLFQLILSASACFAVSTLISASDLHIYAGPAAGGQKTPMMMLDRSGSTGMLADDYANNSIVDDDPELRNADKTANYRLCGATGTDGKTKYKNDESYTDSIFTQLSDTKRYCTNPSTKTRRYDRLTRLKAGMFALWNSPDPKLDRVFIGLGYYSNNASTSRVITVPAQALAKVDSEHRKLLKQHIVSISAGASTHTAHAYAAAASYLMATTAVTHTYPSLSGFANSTAKRGSHYLSPLAAVHATCDDQGISILSDGQPNHIDNMQSAAIMAKAFNETVFSCDVRDGLINSAVGWKCMEAFARSLYSGINPKQRPIQTAFLHLGKEFSGLISSSLAEEILNTCGLGSAPSGNACSDYENDKPTPKPVKKFRNTPIGFGNAGLRVVNASSGQEQVVFNPSHILNDAWQSMGLKKNFFHKNGPTHGMDAPWVVDPSYAFEASKDISNQPVTQVKATKVLVYGGMRMGESSYYGLDMTNSNAPKFKFRMGANQAAYSAMGQSGSKPILANIRFNGKVRRVLVVSGGYDSCYADPRFQLAKNYTWDRTKSAVFKRECSNKAKAKGNAVYIVDAETGERVFWVSDTGADINNARMIHSVVSDVSTVDTNADGFIDHLYFGDLGGQVFRVDLNNLNQSSTGQNFGVRAVRIADLATNNAGLKIPLGDQPRFYQAPTLTMHREQAQKFLLVGMVSGDRSSPLDVAPIGHDRPSTLAAALSARPTNKVYGIIDTDVMRSDLNTNYSASYNLDLKEITLNELLPDPQVFAKAGVAALLSNFYPYANSASSLKKYGWYRSLSSNAEGVERSTTTGIFRTSGGIKAFEAPIAIKNTLVVSTYDPESQSLAEQDPYQVRVIGESFRQYYCLPFGVCLKAGTTFIDLDAEKETGWKPAQASEKLSTETIRTAQGKGILGSVLVDKPARTGNCGSVQLGGNTQGSGEWACIAQTQAMNWFAK